MKNLAIGPLTNVAMAMNMDPSIGEKLKSLTIMGGNIHGVGNITNSAEFNFYADPEAAFVVLDRLPKSCIGTIIPWETTIQNFFSGTAIGLERGKSKLGDFLFPRTVKMRGQLSPTWTVDETLDNMCICDLLAPVALLNPELIIETGN